MSLKHRLMPLLAQLLTSEALLHWRRNLSEWQRRLQRRPHEAVFYFRVDDPYSILLAQVLPAFSRHFGIRIRPRVMLYLDQQLYPAADMLAELAPRDALRLAQLHGLDFPENWQLPAREVSLAVSRSLLKYENDERFWNLATALGDALWSRQHQALENLLADLGQTPADQAQLALEARRDQLLQDGHYLTGTLHYGGEWYWSLERLDHLAQRLNDLGLGSADWPLPYGRAKRALLKAPAEQAQGSRLELFFSFRSPYSYLALARSYALADHYDLDLTIRPVLPMVMRGLAVPKAKRMYILMDAAREARLQRVPFGKICDPLGTGVERCMAIWPFAEKEGRLREWLQAAATGIWSQGINPATDNGLKFLVENAGLDWQRARRWLDDDSWRDRAESNRQDMMNAGSWGVPSFACGDTMIWGQDRFALIEQCLLSSASQQNDSD